MKISINPLAVFGLLCVAMLSGCYVSQREITFTGTNRIPAGAAVAIAQPFDASYAGENYPGSGYAVATKLAAALAGYYQPQIGAQGTYAIVPEIYHWEDRVTEWNGRPDKIKIMLPLYKSGHRIGSAVITARSSWWTFGGDHPEDLLEQPLASYAAYLAGKPNPHAMLVKER